MAQSVKLNFFYNILLNISKVLFPLITAPYVARVLEPDGIGLFNFASTYANYFALFAILGTSLYSVREIAKMRDDLKAQEKFVSEIMSLLTCTTVFCSILFIGSVFLVPQLYQNYAIFLVSGLTLYLTPVTIEWFYSGREEFGYITFRALFLRIISIVFLFLLVKTKDDLLVYVGLNAVMGVINIVWNYIKMWQLGVRPRFTWHFKQHIKPLLLLFSANVAVSIYTMLDTLMLGFMTNYEEVGYYNSAINITRNLLPVATSLSAVAMPRLAYYMKQGDWNQINVFMDKSLSVVSFLCFPIAFGVMAIAPTFVPLFYGDMFYGAILPLQIVIGVAIAIGLNNLLGMQTLLSLGHDKLFLYSLLVGTFSNFFTNLIVIPKFGASGAAAASVFAETLIAIVMLIFVYKYTQVRFHRFREAILSALIAFGFFPLLYLMQLGLEGWPLVGAFILGGGLYYIGVQYLVKNSSVMIFVNLVKNKISKKKE